MSLLSGSRQEKKNVINSQNIAWQNDDSKFGKVMLEKMGWKPGCGLGKNEQGITENLKMKANISTRGLGCNERNDEVWIAHHDSFETLLADLNKKKGKSKANPIKKNLNKVKSKIILNEHRKDRHIPTLSMMSKSDKCAIFGKKSLRSVTDRRNIEENMHKDEVELESSSENIIVNKTSMKDYFAQKMLRLNERRKV